MTALSEVARRVYRDLVRGRSRVRVVDARPADADVAPIFIVGLYRSGTTLLRYVLDSHSRIACPPESEFLQPLDALAQDDNALEGLAGMGFDRAHVVRRIRTFATYFFANYAASAHKPRWADKSPRYVDHLPFLQELFPDAHFVVIHRYPLDQIASFTRDGTFCHPDLQPYATDGEDRRLAGACYWTAKTQQILSFEATHRNRVCALTYSELCRAPESTLRRVFDFVEEPWEPDVLAYHRVDHDLGREAGRPSGTRGFDEQEGRYRAWPDELQQQCLRIVAEPLAALDFGPR